MGKKLQANKWPCWDNFRGAGIIRDLEKRDIVGVWSVCSFLIGPEDAMAPWEGGCHGTLIYTRDGYMSLSLNADNHIDYERSTLFYSGSYILENNQVHHTVKNAANPERIDKTVVRDVVLNDGRLALSTTGDFGNACIVFKKLQL